MWIEPEDRDPHGRSPHGGTPWRAQTRQEWTPGQRERSWSSNRAAGRTAPPATIPLLMEDEVASEPRRGAVRATAAATWRSAGQGLFYGPTLAVSVAKAVTLGLGTNALSRAGGSAVLAREGLAPGISLW
jgi:hypothetical protein